MNARDELFATVYPLVMRQIEQGSKPTPEFLRESVAAFAQPLMMMNPELQIGDEDSIAVARRVETLIDIDLGEAVVIEKGYEAWLDNRRASIDPYYWTCCATQPCRRRGTAGDW